MLFFPWQGYRFPSLARGDLYLLPAVDAMVLQNDGGCEWESLSTTRWYFEQAATRNTYKLREFVARDRTWQLSSTENLHDLGLVKAVSQLIERGVLVGVYLEVSGGAKTKAIDGATLRRQLVSDIERATRGKLLNGGRTYKLTADVDLGDLPDRDRYEVVGQRDAGRILDELAHQPGTLPELAALLAQAREKLTRDWRPPLQPNGLILLRRVIVPRARTVDTGPAMTPAQIQKLKEQIEFSWDPPFSHRQWVNLPKSWGVVAFGTEATLTGHVEPRTAGQNVTFALLPDPANPPEATGAALASTTATSDGEGKVRLKITFPIYPSTKFRVSGKTATMKSPVETGAIEVWRRVFYQVTEMTAAPDGTKFTCPADLIPALEGAFNPVWIELAPGTKRSATTPYKAHLTAAERASVENSLRGAATDDKSPFKMNIVLIDSADIVAEQEWTAQTAGPSVETLPFTKWVHEPTIIRAEYEQSAGVWTPLANVLVVDLAGGRAKVTASIPGSPAVPVQVRIKYRFQRGFAGGWGGTSGTIFMCIGRQRRANPASPSGADLQQALTHEIGHALGLVSTTASWRDPDPRDAGYSLRHCGYKTPSNEPRCVMWFMLGGSGDRLRFCKSNAPDDCSHFLMHADLSTIRWI